MGIFGSIVEALVLPVFDPRNDLPLGRSIAPQLVGDEHRGARALLF
jgi:hypothetical protein